MSASEPLVVLTGASGFVGRALAPFLQARGWTVRRLVRRSPRKAEGEYLWDPARGTLDLEALRGARAVVHLAGENVAAGRWTAARKKRIRESRVEGTGLLARTLSESEHPPDVLVMASAVGWYGDCPEGTVDETAPLGRGFLAEVCRDWEASATPAAKAGLRVVTLRLGVVLDRDGGMLARVLPAFRLGLGGRIGSGRQAMSWVSRTDLLRVVEWAMSKNELSGPLNVTAPEATTNAEFTRTLGRALRRPTLAPIPGWVIRLALAEMGQALLLDGARVRPSRLLEQGFAFEHPTLDAALTHALDRSRKPEQAASADRNAH